MKTPFDISGNPTWATAVYFGDFESLPPAGLPNFLLEDRRLFRGLRHIHTYADPFLFCEGEDLYLFVETQVLSEHGKISAYASHGGKDFEHIGIVLEEPFHLSYPNVFRIGDKIYMIPESQGSDAVRLYEFLDFPRNLVFRRELLIGKYADPSPFLKDGIWYMFATSSRGLELFFSDDLVAGDLTPHPANPITQDARYRRCGGVPFDIGARLIRPAQDCSRRYGENLSLMEIESLSPETYRERLHQAELFEKQEYWNRWGGHHISICDYDGRTAIAVDGQSEDYPVHRVAAKYVSLVESLCGWFRRIFR